LYGNGVVDVSDLDSDTTHDGLTICRSHVLIALVYVVQANCCVMIVGDSKRTL